MTERTRQIRGATVPTLLYGTAWKEERTADVVAQALRMGFRGLDTANQRRHYCEAEVGRALLAELQRGTLRREDVFVQTKFTFRRGQDHRLPYDPAAPSRARLNNPSTAPCHTSAWIWSILICCMLRLCRRDWPQPISRLGASWKPFTTQAGCAFSE